MVKTISADEFVLKIKKGQIKNQTIIDVREGFEWDLMHLKLAKHIPLQTLPMIAKEWPKSSEERYVICAHGVRSANATIYLTELGFTNIINVEGGMSEVCQYIDENDDLFDK